MATFSETKSPTSQEKIEKIEKYLGLNFPKEYSQHLLKHNGGRCKPDFFRFIERTKPSDSLIDSFLAIHDGPSNSLMKYIDTYKIVEKRLPRHMLPIARDPGGNLICISCGNDDCGYVFFWDHESEVDYNLSNDSDYDNLSLIAKSFNSFINGLEKNPFE